MNWSLVSITEIMLATVLLCMGLLALLWYMDRQTLSFRDHTYSESLKSLRERVDAIAEVTSKLDASPQFRGTVGENIVETVLDILPPGCVTKQYSGSDIPGRPDFVIELPNMELKLVVDAKFSSDVERSSRQIMKYIVPGVTFDFVLMWLPDFAYFEMDDELLLRLIRSKVIPVTTATLVSVIFLVKRAHNIFQVSEEVMEYQNLREIVYNTASQGHNHIERGLKQLNHGITNINVGKELFEELGRKTQ